MLSVFFGSDTVMTRKRAYDAVRTAQDRGADVLDLSSETYEEGALRDALESVSLFSTTRIVVLDHLRELGDPFAFVLEIAPELVSSKTAFVIIEGELTPKEQQSLKKVGASVYEYTHKAEERFNTFSLADALARRDKKSLWILYLRAVRSRISIEEVIGTLFWQVKSIKLAFRATSATEAGMKDFPYRKAKAATKLYAEGEVDRIARTLVSLYHDGHRGERESDLGLEKLILTL